MHHGTVEAMTNADAVRQADVVLLTFPCPTSPQMIANFAHQLGDCSNKVVIDVTNPVGPDMKIKYQGGMTSAGEEFAHALGNAKVYKAFNTIGAQHMKNPLFAGRYAQMMFAGPSGGSKALVERVITG
jgi:hypothetical protein